MNELYVWPALVTAIALLVYLVLTINVGRARFKYKVEPPNTTGDPGFERAFRVHQNTNEQLFPFLAALWLFSIYLSPTWGAIVGGIWILGRIAFAWGYYQATEKRMLGFAINSLSLMVLLLGSLIGIGLVLFDIRIA